MSTNLSKGSKKRLEVWLPADFIDRIDVARAAVGLSRAAFAKMALSAYIRKWVMPTKNAALHEPCSICGKKHDKEEHFR